MGDLNESAANIKASDPVAAEFGEFNREVSRPWRYFKHPASARDFFGNAPGERLKFIERPVRERGVPLGGETLHSETLVRLLRAGCVIHNVPPQGDRNHVS